MSENTTFLHKMALVTIATCLAFGGTTSGEEKEKKIDAKEILKRCDDFHFFAKDMFFKINVTLTDKNGKKTYMKMELYQKAPNKRLLRFTEPKDIAGFSVLSKDENTMYVYEPSLGKVRRIASHAKKQTMMGNDFTLDEASTFRFGNDYDPKIIEETEKAYILYLTQKPGKEKAWPIIKLHVSKENWMAYKIEYHDEKGNLRKTETRTNVKKFDGYPVVTVLRMVDHGKNHSTTYEITEAKINRGLEDSFFTKRTLVREE